MSKHFELLQQIEKEQSNGSVVNAAPFVQKPGRNSNDIGPGQWASDEALRLVQQVFLLQTQDPPRVVVFAGVDHGNGCSQICAAVAETLAKNAEGKVCLV